MDHLQPPEESPYVIAIHLKALFEYVRAQGFADAPVIAACGLSEDDLADTDRRISDMMVDQAFIAAEKLCNDANIGLHVGRNVRATHYGMLGHLMLTCTNLVEMMDLHMRYAQLVGNGISAQYRMENGLMCLEVHEHPARLRSHRHTNEFNVAGWISLARWLVGAALSPTRIEIPNAAPDDVSEQSEFFECPLSFGATRLRIYFDPKLMQIPFLHGNSDLHRTMEAEVHKRLLAL